MRLLLLCFLQIFFIKSFCQTVSFTVDNRDSFIYSGIDNIITITVLNEIEKPIVTVLYGVIKKISGFRYSIKPSSGTICEVVVTSFLDTTKYILKIPVRSVPPPEILVNGKFGSGKLTATELKKTDSIALKLKEGKQVIPFIVESFKLTRLSKGFKTSCINIGKSYSLATRRLLNKSVHNDIYSVDSVTYSIDNKKYFLDKKVFLEIL